MKNIKINIDQSLVLKLKSGDENSFGKLYDKYHDVIYKYAFSLIKSQSEAEEIVQDIFVNIWLNRQKLKPNLSFKFYLYTIAKNKTYDLLVKASRELKLKQQVFYKSKNAYNAVDDYILNQEYSSLLRRAIEKLPPKRRRIFIMSRFEGKSYKDISNELGLTNQTVKNQMSTALASIRMYLKSHGEISYMIIHLILINII